MLRITVRSHADGKIPEGEQGTFALEKQDSGIETRSFLSHEGLLFLKPLLDWTRDDTIPVLTEAPGHYRLHVEWRTAAGARGWVEQPFHVVSAVKIDNTPRIVKIDRALKVWVPSAWESVVLKGQDRAMLQHLGGIIKSGWVVYDVGASLGIYSLRFSQLVKDAGHVYSIEANPVCVYFLHATRQLNKMSNCEIVPTAILDGDKQVGFTINYSNFGLGVSQDSEHFHGKTGHEIAVKACSLDDLVDAHNLRRPDFVKIDIEGAEGRAVAGMARSIAQHRPVVLIEVHGQHAAAETFQAVDWSAYRFEHPAGREKFADAEGLLAWFPEAVLQIICLPK